MTLTTIRPLTGLDDMDNLRSTAQAVWGSGADDMVSSDYLMALSHCGGYIAGAYSPDGLMIGCSFGMLARHRGDWCLHSHITGVLPGIQNMGIGTLIKQHQREWAIDNDLSAITWTFDPLVRRNAWFNIAHLGAEAVEFHENFYGPLNDDINGDDETDRLLARWDIRPSRRQPAPNALSLLIPTPPDIVTLRTTDPEGARQWRRTMREQLSGALITHEICSFTSDGSYVLSRKISDD